MNPYIDLYTSTSVQTSPSRCTELPPSHHTGNALAGLEFGCCGGVDFGYPKEEGMTLRAARQSTLGCFSSLATAVHH